MPPTSSNDNSAYKNKIKLDLEKLKNGQTQNVKVDLTKVNKKTLASQIGVLSEGVKLYMELLASKRYYALNDRTTNLPMEGDVDMGATTTETGEGEPVFSDGELKGNLKQEAKVEVFITEKIRQDQEVHSFHILILQYSIYLNGIFSGQKSYEHNCLHLALQSGGLSDIKLQELIFSLRNRHIHKCHLIIACGTVEIHIELIPLRSNGENRVEHYGKYFDEQWNLGLVKGHYFIWFCRIDFLLFGTLRRSQRYQRL